MSPEGMIRPGLPGLVGKILVAGCIALTVAPGPARAQGVDVPGGGTAAESATPAPGLRLARGRLRGAGRSGAQDERRLLRVLGEGARRLVRSGNPVQDRAALERFAVAYATKHAILRPAPDRAVLQVGEDDWPQPIPLRWGADGRWHFDVRAGEQELLDRRFGRNELAAIQTLRAIVDPERDYAHTAGRQGPFQAYARRFFSSPGSTIASTGRPARASPRARSAPSSPQPALAATAAVARRRNGRSPTMATCSSSWSGRGRPRPVAPWAMW